MKYLTLLCFVFIPFISHAQDLTWEPLNVQVGNERYNDLCFVDPLTGWAAYPGQGSMSSRVIHTTDGGDTWNIQLEMESHFRALTFLDKKRGFVSTLFGDDISPLYFTTDGGTTWDTVMHFNGPIPAGICGMRSVGPSTVVGIGRIFGPAIFIRTTDAGKTWHSQTLPDNIKSGIDCHFWSSDSGIIVGGTTPQMQGSHTVILGTTDGGQTWVERFRGTGSPEWCWKIIFRTPDHGYIAVEDRDGESNMLVTTDRGLTWEERSMHINHNSFQGIGFITDSIGWTGSRSATVMTTDAGNTWTHINEPRNVNRFCFFGDTLGYVAGERIYRLKRQTSTSSIHLKVEISDFLYSYNPTQSILSSQKSIEGELVITDAAGRTVMTRTAADLLVGISLKELAKGAYFCRFSPDKLRTIKILIH